MITRVGRKEDVAFVRNVTTYNLCDLIVSISGNVNYKTRFYIPTRLVTTVANSRRWVLREVVSGAIREEAFEVAVMGIPSPVPIIYKPRLGEAVLIRLVIDGGEEYVPIPREVIGSGC